MKSIYLIKRRSQRFLLWKEKSSIYKKCDAAQGYACACVCVLKENRMKVSEIVGRLARGPFYSFGWECVRGFILVPRPVFARERFYISARHTRRWRLLLSAPTPAESLTFRKVHPLPQNRVEKHTPPCQPTQELLIIKFLRVGQNS